MSPQTRLVGLFELLAATALGLAACGGSAGDMGQMKLAVADAPVDGAQAVVVKFTGVELTANSGSPVDITFTQPKTIDLLNQSGTASAVLFDQPIPAGSYGQIRLMVVADGNPSNSYIMLSDGTMHGLQVPSGSETGLKLVTGFTVPSSGVVDYTIDFDLRQAITCPPGQAPACILKPVERLVDNTSVGNIQGQVASTLPRGCTPGVYLYNGAVTKPEDMNSNASGDPNQPVASKVPVANSGQTATVDIAFGSIQGQITKTLPTGCTPGVYLYSGNVTAPEDWNSTAPSTDTNQPLNSTLPVATSVPPYSYQFTALPPGTYTLALTCQAALDNRARADPAVTFSPVMTGIVVTADHTTTVNIS